VINDFEFYLCLKEMSFVTLKQDTYSHFDIDLIVRSGWQAERRMNSILQDSTDTVTNSGTLLGILARSLRSPAWNTRTKPRNGGIGKLTGAVA
jgi:hypothetical protein